MKLPDTAVNRRYAERVARQIELDLLAGRFDRTLADYTSSDSGQGSSLLEVWDQFLAMKAKTVKPKTLEKYEVTAKSIVDFFSNRSAGSITEKEAEHYLKWLTEDAVVPQTGKPLSADQKMRRLQEVATCWAWALKQRLVNPGN